MKVSEGNKGEKSWVSKKEKKEKKHIMMSNSNNNVVYTNCNIPCEAYSDSSYQRAIPVSSLVLSPFPSI